MNIIQNREGESLKIGLEGRLDALTSRQLEGVLRTAVSGITDLEFDFAGLEYISSGGIRVLLAAYKVMKRQGKMTIRNVQPEVMEIFEFADLTDILTFV